MNIEKELIELSELKYKKFQEKLCPGISNILGVRIPILRKYAKSLLKKDYRSYLDNPLSNYQEEIMLEGMLIAYSKISIEEKISYLEKFIPKINNWACCDIVVSSFKLNDYDKDKIFKFLTKYKNSCEDYELRFMIVMFLNYYLDSKYLNRVLTIINNIKLDSYYVNMAIAWLLSYVYIRDKNLFNNFIESTKLNKDIIKKTYTKIIESNKVSVKEKEELKKKRLFF